MIFCIKMLRCSSNLEDIQKTLEKLAERTTFKAFWHAERDGKVLAGFKEKSNRFIALLDLQFGIEIHHLVSGGGEGRQNATITYENIKLAIPTTPGVLTGRDELVTEGVDKLCKRDQTHLAILGAGGMGKTSLALHIMEHTDVRKKFPQNRYFVPCEMLPDAPSLIQGLLQIFKLSMPEGKHGYEILETYLQSSQEPILLVLDNFETPWYSAKNQKAVQNLIEKIHDQRKVSIIITMRGAEGPGDIEWEKLGGKSGLPPLTLGAAREAFLSISPSTKESKELDTLLKELDCMPLAVLLMAQLSKRLPLEILIKNWTSSKTNMLRNGNQDSRLTSMNTSIDLSLSMVVSRDPGSTKIIPMLAYLPNGVPFWSLNVPQLSPEFGNDIAMSIMNIIDSGLIYEEGTSLRMLSPIREYVQTKHPVTQHHLDQISKFYVQLLQDLPHSKLEAQDLLELHTTNISTIFIRKFEIGPQQAHLDAIYCFAKFSKFFPQTLPMLEWALTQAWNGGEQEHINIRFLKAQIMRWMGYNQQAILEIQKIQASIDQVSSWREYFPQEVQNGWKTKTETLAKCQLEMGEIYYRIHEYPEAIEKLTDAKMLFEKIGNQLGAAQCLRSLGDAHRLQGEYPQAIEKLTDAKMLFEKIGDQQWAACCLIRLGDIYRMQHKYPQALEKLTDARIQFERIGAPLDAAQCLQGLGDLHCIQEEYPQAIKKLTDAKSQFEKIGSQLGAAQCLSNLAQIQTMQGEYSQAMEKLMDAKSQFKKIGDQVGTAECLQSLGDIHYIQGEYPQAIEKFTDAECQFKMIGNQGEVAQCLKSLGDSYFLESEYPKAREKLTNAKSLFEKIGDQDGAAQCLETLDNIHLKLSMNPTSEYVVGP
ncbi:TPR-like protein [Gymnopus androsaceus JB14]|uniref:TPR-like protein n=1 Tax=Gymnopus androsaceus JB14 TaxID=1447944 RepID=A0A6A4I8D6_9AGAR|nr:TPR-like protein [Gymnopus androsaceus JB14]